MPPHAADEVIDVDYDADIGFEIPAKLYNKIQAHYESIRAMRVHFKDAGRWKVLGKRFKFGGKGPRASVEELCEECCKITNADRANRGRDTEYRVQMEILTPEGDIKRVTVGLHTRETPDGTIETYDYGGEEENRREVQYLQGIIEAQTLQMEARDAKFLEMMDKMMGHCETTSKMSENHAKAMADVTQGVANIGKSLGEAFTSIGGIMNDVHKEATPVQLARIDMEREAGQVDTQSKAFELLERLAPMLLAKLMGAKMPGLFPGSVSQSASPGSSPNPAGVDGTKKPELTEDSNPEEKPSVLNEDEVPPESDDKAATLREWLASFTDDQMVQLREALNTTVVDRFIAASKKDHAAVEALMVEFKQEVDAMEADSPGATVELLSKLMGVVNDAQAATFMSLYPDA